MKRLTVIRLVLIGVFFLLAGAGMIARPIGSWHLFMFSWLGLIVLVGLVGIFLCQGWFRVLLWLLSIPPLFFGILALSSGGIAEPFSAGQMWIFCSFAFWPVVGCTVGEFITHWRQRERDDHEV